MCVCVCVLPTLVEQTNHVALQSESKDAFVKICNSGLSFNVAHSSIQECEFVLFRNRMAVHLIRIVDDSQLVILSYSK